MRLNPDVDFECSIETFKSSLTRQLVGWGNRKDGLQKQVSKSSDITGIINSLANPIIIYK